MADLTLSFDTSGAYCAAALLDGETCLGRVHEPMKRGQAERLMMMLEELLAHHGHNWQALARIGVGVGPGNFTGIRISVAAARGLALSLGVPGVGINTFEATLYGHDPLDTALVAAPREQVYVWQAGQDIRLDEAVNWSGQSRAFLPPEPAQLAENIARLARSAAADAPPPAPLYVRPADAAPASDPPPVILPDAAP